MRDLFIFGAICVMLAATLKRPQVGILSWMWVSVMNPHRSTYGWLYDFPINDIIAFVTISSCIIHWKNRRGVEFSPIIGLLIVFYSWTTLTTIFAVDFDLSFVDWLNFTKTLLLVGLILLFMNRKHWIIAAISVFILSIGFTGVKGGLFTILTGGQHRVWGPPGTAWGDNNSVSVAMLMCLPFCIALRHLFKQQVLKLATIIASILMFVTVLGTQSRGALVGLLGMGLVMILRSHRRLPIILVVSIALPTGYMLMPDSWKSRMATIQNYEEDASATNRIIQWYYAIDIANERPLFGNGFDAFYHQPYYNRYVADKDKNRSVHSNYFQVLGEQGYIGLLLYLSLMAAAFFSAGKWSKKILQTPNTHWSSPFLETAQFSIAGYAFNGLTLNIAYIDLYYIVLSFIILMIAYNKQFIPGSVAIVAQRPR